MYMIRDSDLTSFIPICLYTFHFYQICFWIPQKNLSKSNGHVKYVKKYVQSKKKKVTSFSYLNHNMASFYNRSHWHSSLGITGSLRRVCKTLQTFSYKKHVLCSELCVVKPQVCFDFIWFKNVNVNIHPSSFISYYVQHFVYDTKSCGNK